MTWRRPARRVRTTPSFLDATKYPASPLFRPMTGPCHRGAVAVLYPLCRWYPDVKRRPRDPWLSYL